RLALPELPVADFLTKLASLVAADEPWVPVPTGEEALYLRPFMFASEEFLGVRAAHVVDYYAVASPAGNYSPRGVEPLVVRGAHQYSGPRAGGTGDAKWGGNYAPRRPGKHRTAQPGAGEVMFLDAATRSSIGEVSGRSVFAITADDRILTPALTSWSL